MPKSNDLAFSDFTIGERARIAALTIRAAKRGLAGPNVCIDDLTRRIEAIERQALRRKNRK